VSQPCAGNYPNVFFRIDQAVAELAARAISGGQLEIQDPGLISLLRGYVEQLVGDEWAQPRWQHNKRGPLRTRTPSYK
jgi:hypothetical protein